VRQNSQDTIPFAPDAERAVLGSIILDQKPPDDGLPDKSLFYAQSNRNIIDAMQALDKKGLPIDAIQLLEELRQAGCMDQTLGGYVATLTDGAIRLNFKPALDRLVETAAKREIWMAASKAADESLNGKLPDDISRDLRAVLDRISTDPKGLRRWPEPKPLTGGRMTAPKLRKNMLPAAIAPWLVDISERLQVPLDFAAIPALVSLATVIGSKVRIRPKQYDDWTVVCNLWGAIIGDPGLLKSPTIEQATKPLRRLIAQREAEHKERMKQFALDAEAEAERKRDLQKQIKAAIAEKQDPTTLRMQLLGDELQPPVEKRYMVNDATVEKLGELLAENTNGLLMFRDELTGWLRTLDQPKNANERAFYLEAWNGGQPYTYDRIGRGTTRIPNTTMSVVGGIQPGPLVDYLAAANANGVGADGLIQRFQLAIWPDDPGPYVHIDRWPDTDAKNKAFRIFEYLDSMEPSKERFDKVEAKYAFLRFELQAQGLFNDWYTELQNRVRSETSDPAFRSHMAKFGSLFASLALVFHLCEVADCTEIPDVSLAATKMALHWCDYLESHARKIYGLQVAEADESVKRLAVRLKAGEIENGFQVRHLQHKRWQGLSKAEEISSALSLLCDANWLEQIEVESLVRGGKPKVRYQINPRIKDVEVC
jgi:hypothetical protein